MFSCEFCEISRNTFSYTTPLLAASDFFNLDLTDKFLKSVSYLPKNFFLFASMKVLLKWWKYFFISAYKLFSSSRYLIFSLDFLFMEKKQLDHKDHSLQKNRWSGSRLLCSIILKSMLSDVLMWSKWVRKHCKRSQKTYSAGKNLYRFPDFINRRYFTVILKTMILTALVNSVTGTEIFKIRSSHRRCS